MKCLLIWATMCVLAMGMIGCANTSSGVSNNVQDVAKYTEDVRAFTKIGTTVILQKANLSCEHLDEIRAYVLVVQGFVATPKPDYAAARQLISAQLSENLRPTALMIIDLIERYAPVPKLNDDVMAYQKLAQTALDAVLAAVNDYESLSK